MQWQELLQDYSNVLSKQDTMGMALFLLRIINLQDLQDFQVDNNKIDFYLVNKSISESTANGNNDDYYQQIFIACIELVVSLKCVNIENQIKSEIEIVNLLSKKLIENPSFFLTPIIIIVNDLRKNVITNYNDGESQIVDLFTNAIQRPFKILISNKSDNQINISAVHIFASHLFSIYFRYNKLNAVINLYKVLLNTILNDAFNRNTKIEVVPILPTKSVFDYFVGLSLLIQSNYSKSLQYFQSAYDCKHSKSMNTKILFYLLPLNYLIKNKLPRDMFFQKKIHKPLLLLQPLFNSIKRLDAQNYNALLLHYKPLLLHFRVYGIYVQLHMKIFFTILATTYNVFKSITNSAKPHIVPISVFSTGLSLPPPQAESILCRLIASNNIKGYISHSQQVIVLSKSTPFVYSVL